MADAFVTLISVQPMVAVPDVSGAHKKNVPQTTDGVKGNIYYAKRTEQVHRAKIAPPGMG